MARDMGSIIGIAAVAGLGYWAYTSGLFGSLFGSSSSVAPTGGTNPGSGAGTNPVTPSVPVSPPPPPPAPPVVPTCSGSGILAPLLSSVQRAQGSTFGTNLPGVLNVDQWDWYLDQLCSGMSKQWKLTADDLFPGAADRGGPLNWNAFYGAATQAGLSGPGRRIGARVARGRILRRVA